MNYIQRNLLPLTVGLLALVVVIVGTGSVVMRMRAEDRITDEQFERELGRRIDGAMRMGSATLGLQLDPDLKVTGVIPNGPGDAAGIKVDDRIVAVNGNEVWTVDEARTRLAAVPQNSEYAVTVSRQGKNVDLKAKKGSAMADLGGLFQRFTDQAPQFGRGRGAPGRPDGQGAPQSSPAVPTQGVVLGVSLQAVTGGLRVLTVMPSSPAATAGIAADDVIVSANGRATPTVEGLQGILQAAGPGAAVRLNVKRNDQQITLTAQLEPRT